MLDTLIETVSGIGPILGAIVLSEIGDITRFKDASKLVVFAGIDPTVKQSGEFIGTQNKKNLKGIFAIGLLDITPYFVISFLKIKNFINKLLTSHSWSLALMPQRISKKYLTWS